MGKALWGIAAVIFSIGFLVFPAQAVVVGGDSCATCFGSVYTLTVTPIATGYEATLNIDTSLFTGPNAYLYISAVDFKVASDILSGSLSLVSAPDGTSAWNTLEANLSSGLCSGGGSGFGCSESAVESDPVFIGRDAVNTWVWDFALPEGVSLFSPDLLGSHIGAKYDNIDGTLNGRITSEVAVPEPSTLLLLGSGLVGLAGIAWKRNRRE